MHIVVRPGTDVTLHTEFESESACLVIVEDSGGTAIFSEYVVSDELQHVRLAPGGYTWKITADDQLLRSQSFTVGSTPTTILVRR
jgi:hypothetical protein